MNGSFWAPMGVSSLHIFEEFVYPGGFAKWDRHYRPGFRASITPRFHIINRLLLLLCYDVGAMGGTPIGIAGWLAVLYVPLAIYGWSEGRWRVIP